jgi:hypothetical protein
MDNDVINVIVAFCFGFLICYGLAVIWFVVSEWETLYPSLVLLEVADYIIVGLLSGLGGLLGVLIWLGFQ